MTTTRRTLRDALAAAASSVRVSVYRRAGVSQGYRRPRTHRGVEGNEPQFVDLPGARSAKLARVEAVLFAAGEPLSTRRIADAANLTDGAEARVLLQQLKG